MVEIAVVARSLTYWVRFYQSSPQYFTPHKAANLILVQAQARFLRNRRVVGRPYWVDMDPTNVCNLRCPLCPTGQRAPGRAKGFMTFERFRKIFDEISSSLFVLRLFSWGEPFLNRDLVKMIAHAHQAHVKTVVGTNLHFLDAPTARGLVEAGLDEVILSIDGATRPVYGKYRVGGRLDTVLDHLELLATTRREQRARRPLIVWQFLVFRHNQHELSQALEKARALGCDRFRIGGARVDMGRELTHPVEQLVEADAGWLSDDPQYGRYDLRTRRQRIKKETCYMPWTSAAINWDGSMAPCSGVYSRALDFGDVSQEGFAQVWNNSKYQSARAVLAGRSGGDEETVCHICARHGNYIRGLSSEINLRDI